MSQNQEITITQPENSNSSMLTNLTLKMVNMLDQQIGLFKNMTTIMNTLSQGFNALTQAIRKNTEVMMKLTVGPKVGMSNILAGAIPTNKLGQPTMAGQKFQEIDEWLKGAFTTMLPTISESNLKGNANSTDKPTTESMMKDLMTSMKDGLKGLGQGIWDVFKGVSKTTLGAAVPGSGLATEGLKDVGGGFKGIFKNTFGLMGTQLKAAMTPLKTAFSSMFPQMAMLALVMEPVMAFISGLLDPLSMITDMFGAFGEILGTALIPVLVNSIMPLLTSMLPLFTSLAQILAPVIQLLFSFTGLGILTQILTPLMPLFNTLIGIFGQIMIAISPLLELFSSLISMGIGAIFDAIKNAFSSMGISMEDITNAITKFANVVQQVVAMISGFIDYLSGNMSWKEYQTLGTNTTGGGLDQSGWW